jgi:hypothetical protein
MAQFYTYYTIQRVGMIPKKPNANGMQMGRKRSANACVRNGRGAVPWAKAEGNAASRKLAKIMAKTRRIVADSRHAARADW